jgi:hypothetical protein
MKIDRGLPSDNSGPDKANSKELCPSTEDAEAEAEAAASAVAVAAISTDEGSPADATTASAPDKSFTSKDLSGLTSGGMIFALSTTLIKTLLYDYVAIFIVLWTKLKQGQEQVKLVNHPQKSHSQLLFLQTYRLILHPCPCGLL